MSSNNTDRADIRPDGDFSGMGRRILRGAAIVVLVVLAALLAASTIVLVDESEYVFVERLGNIVAVYDRPADRGLQFKLPWPIDQVRRFDRRVQLLEPAGREVFTRDKKNITVETYICWRIAEPREDDSPSASDRPVVRFFRGLTNVDVAEARLDSRVRSILSTEIGQVELSRLLDVDDSEAGPEEGEAGAIELISDRVQQKVMQRPDEEGSLRDALGVEIVDVRIKRLNLPYGNQQAVFERMKSERKKIADRYRSAGMADNTVIKSQADRQSNEILARARADAERIRGQAEADSINILNRAHAQDPEFYKVLRTLETYRTILNEKTTLVLSASSNLLKLLSEGVPEIESTPPAGGSPSEPEPTDSNEKVSAVPPEASVLDGLIPASERSKDETSGSVDDEASTDSLPAGNDPSTSEPSAGGSP